ncbi:DUF4255 domain-containing protein [Methylobacter marinus]|uniref:DUF4255 domain-containing protein n=1 Tax=Methylobacter marinus TaxID=34058 RepID=UPI00037EC4A6|nr:DUF4255 domain-containing protein [Methylobacter marinus]
MSSPLAIAGVTAVLKDHLNKGSTNIDLDLASIGPFTVSALPPDRIQTGANEENRINLFLYQVTPNQGWRNQGMPSIGSNGERLSNPPLALDLHYMLTTYGKEDLNAEVLWGYAMELFHELVLDRSDIRNSLSLIPANPLKIAQIPADEDGRTAIDLADQIERIKIIPNYLSADELSRLWTAMQARYRPTMVYQVSTVLIQHNKPAKSPLPVLTRGEKDRGIESQANLDKPVPKAPTLTELKILAIQIKPEDGSEIEIERQTAELGDVLEVRGVHLNGEKITAEFRHRLLFEEDSQGMRTAKPNKVKVTLPLTTPKLRIVLPAATDGTQVKNWPAGQYTLSLSIERDGKILPLTNEMPFLLAPRISAKPTISGSGAEPKLTIKFFPDIWKQQLEDRRVDIHVGGKPLSPEPVTTDTVGELTIPLVGVPASDALIPVTLRVDGVTNELVRDRTTPIPQFDPEQTISLPT